MDTQATAPGDDATAAVHGEAVELAAPTDASPVALAEAAVQTELVFARIHGEPLTRLPQDLYIPPDALEVFLESFEGPLDLLLYLLRRQCRWFHHCYSSHRRRLPRRSWRHCRR